jgi:hypothetical protein
LDPIPWLMGAGLAVMLCVALVAWRLEKQRSAALAEVALRLGLSFQRKHSAVSGEPFARLPLFQRGHSQSFRNVAHGGDLWVFGYSYVTGSGKNRSTHMQTVAALRVAGASLPGFELAPEGFFDRLASSLGGQDIDLDEDPEFSRRYRLRGDDEGAVRRVFGPALRQQLLLDDGGSLEGEGEWLLLYRRAKRVKPAEISAFVERVRAVASTIP